MRDQFDFRTIKVKGMYNVPCEAFAGAAGIMPGDLVARTSAEQDTVVVHATAGAATRRLFAVEADLEGKGITDAYANGARVQLVSALPGDEILARLAAGQNVAKEAALTSNGNGQVKAANGTTDAVLGYARHAVNATDGVQRIIVEIA